MFNILVTTMCDREDAFTFSVPTEALDATTAMAKVKRLLGQAFIESHAERVATGPALMEWWIEGREHEKERTLMTAMMVGASH
jgi:hypothetical protein